MLVSSTHEIGDRLLAIRKKVGLTQVEVAIERGETNMRVETLLRICRVLKVTPDQILTQDDPVGVAMDIMLEELRECSPKYQDTAVKLLSVYLNSLK